MKTILQSIILNVLCVSAFAQTLRPDSTFGTNGKFSYNSGSFNSSSIANGVFRTLLDDSGNLYFSVVPGSGTNTLVVKLNPAGNTVSGFATNGIFTTGSYRSTGISLLDTTLFVTGFNGPGFDSSNNPVLAQKISANKGNSPQLFQTNTPGSNLYTTAVDKNSNILYLGGSDYASGANNFIVYRKDLSAPFTETTTSLGYKILRNTTSGIRYLHRLIVLQDSSLIGVGHNGTNTVAFKIDKNFNMATTFGVNGFSTIQIPSATNNYAYSAVVKDQFIYIGGYFRKSNADLDIYVAKLDLTGKTVSGFGTNGIVTYSTSDSEGSGWDAISIQPNGKILVSGSVTTSNVTYPLVIRLNTDGTLDNTFNNGSSILKGAQSGQFHSIKALSDSTFIVSGNNPSVSYYVLDIQKFTTGKATVLSTNDASSSEASSVKLYYSDKQVYILSQNEAEEVMVTSLSGTVKTYTNVKSFPVEENQVYVVKLRTGNQLTTQKIATY